MCRTPHYNKPLAYVAAFAVTCATLVAAPVAAHAVQITRSIDSTMTISMQHSSGPLPLTGDISPAALIGVLAVCVVSVCCLFGAHKLSFARAPHAGKTPRGAHMQPTKTTTSKKRTLAVVAIPVLLAGLCAGALASKANPLTQTTESLITCDSAVVIDESGNVVSANMTVANTSEKVIDLTGVDAPSELSTWKATYKSTTVAAHSSTSGTWDGKTVPSDILNEVKDKGSATLTFQLEVSYDTTESTDEDGKADIIDEDGVKETITLVNLDTNMPVVGAAVDVDTTAGGVFIVLPASEDGATIEVTITQEDPSGTSTPKQGVSVSMQEANGDDRGTGVTDADGKVIFHCLDYDLFSLEQGTWVYDGSQQRPGVICTGSYTEGVDYEVSYDRNVDAGEGTVAISGIGSCIGAKEFTFTIAKANAQLEWSDTDSFEYNGKNQKREVTKVVGVSGYTLGVTLAVQSGTDTVSEYKNVGEYVSVVTALTGADAANYNLPMVDADLKRSFTITPRLVTVSGITAANKTYDGTTDATLDCTTATLSGCVDDDLGKLSVSATGAFADKNAGTNKTVNISNLVLGGDAVSNYQIAAIDQQTSTTANITQKEVSITWDPAGDAVYSYNATPQSPTATVSGTVEGESLTATLKYESASSSSLRDEAPSDIGIYAAVVASLSAANADTNADNYKLPSSGTDKIFSIDSNYFTIVYHGNGGTASGHGSSYTQYCTGGTAGTLEANKFTQSGKTFAFWTVGNAWSGTVSSSTLTCDDGYSFKASGDSIITSTNRGTTIHLYAYWKDTSVGNFWTNAADATDPLSGVTNTESTITANKTNSSFWTALYNNDTHLYTYWNGDDAVAFADRFVEFRIIEVSDAGGHLNSPYDANSGDGSTVTFLATHSLPTAKNMNSKSTNKGSWADSLMRTSTFGEGGYVQTGLSGLVDAVTTLNKRTTGGYYKNWAPDSSTADKFWLLSYTELCSGQGRAFDFNYYWEGTQYAWCKANITTTNADNPAIASMGKTRSGSNPTIIADKANYCGGVATWWFRSPSYDNDADFGSVTSGGNPAGICLARDMHGVAPAFAF